MDNAEVYRWALRGLMMMRDSVWAAYMGSVYTGTEIAYKTMTDLVTNMDAKMVDLEEWRSKNCDL